MKLQVFTTSPGGSDFVMAETQLSQALANLNTARARLGYATIVAPRDGVLITPGVDQDILEGITRASVLELAKAMGIPTSMFTVLFAVARTVGWVAQWNEMIEDPAQKIARPRQLYTGYTERPFVPLAKRG